MNVIRLCRPRIPYSFSSFIPLLASLCCVAGCGGDNLPSVSGKVTKGGAPLTAGTVSFHPDASRGNTEGVLASVEIGADGQYTLQAAPGWYKVTVFAEEPRPEDGPEAYAPPVYLVAEEYTSPDTTPLSFEVKAGSSEYDIQLTE